MFPYYGRKKQIIKYYPEPLNDIIIEPFTGAASYSLKYHNKKVILCEINEIIYGIWKYLINSKKEDILRLPLNINSEEFNKLKQEEKDLIGFFIRSCSARPNKTASLHKNFNMWNENNRLKLANNVEKIKHWKVYNCSYEDLHNKYLKTKATWFIDPPYQHGGAYYKYSKIDYKKLKKWISQLVGQIIVCENDKANWLNFSPFLLISQRGKENKEMIYYKKNQHLKN
jgi:hypothetical protein